MTFRSRSFAILALTASLVSAAVVTTEPASADSGDRWVEGHAIDSAGRPLANQVAELGWCETAAHRKGCAVIKYRVRSGNEDPNTDSAGYFRLGWTWKHPAKAGHWVVTINRDVATMVKVAKPRPGRGVVLEPIVEPFRGGSSLPPDWSGPTLSGTVTGANGAPIARTLVWVDGGRNALTDGAGRYALAVPAGTTGLQLSVQAYGYLWYHDVPVIGSFTGQAAVHQDIVMSPQPRVTAKMVLPKSWRTWLTRVIVRDAQEPESDGTAYGAYGPGKVRVDLDPGTYVLTMKARPRAHSSKVRTATRTVTLASGQVLKLGRIQLHKR